ncbi:hypothetical protein GCM10010967_29770 [Dyadobacter beijingensis]|uniref:Lipoprotein n=1 Tax=Dyadobacter beijingensis TaxID=365489 RepID=A0ABQ2HZL8_9BACT|nr:hypothetical protein [Dyadobacter beijingensis]GGM94523.1 hypothetical protein GCM10010967_29770 [Dyadobacter beijingensis]
MKSLLACAVILAMLLGCKKEKEPVEIVEPEVVLTREEVMTDLKGSTYQIAEWYGVSGKDTTFMQNDQFYGAVMKSVFLLFDGDRRVYYYIGNEIPNTTFPGKKRTFDVNVFYFRPIDLGYYWNEKENNMLLEWENHSDNLHIMPRGITLRLNQKGYKRVKTYAQGEAAGTSGYMRFDYDYQGKTYTMLLRQMWNYGEAMPKHNLFVVF